MQIDVLLWMRLGRMPRFLTELAIRWSTSPWLIFGVALVVRIPAIWSRMHEPQLEHMFPEAGAIAQSALLGHGYAGAFRGTTVPTAWFAPGFTLLLMLLFKCFSVLTSARIVLALNLLFSSASAVAIFLVGQKLVGTRPGAIAAWIWALWYYCAAFPMLLDETSLCALLMVAGICAFLRVQRSKHTLEWVAFGVFWGLCCLVNPAFFAVLAVYWTLLWMHSAEPAPTWRWGIVISILVFALTISPWIARNYLVFGKFIFIRSDLPAEVYYANQEGLGNAPADYSSFPTASPAYQQLGESAYLAGKRDELIAFIRNHPDEFARRTLYRVFWYWTIPRGTGMWIVSAGAFVGLGLALWNFGAKALALAVPMIFYPPVYYLVFAFPRHRHPIDPVIVLLFAYGIAWLGGRALSYSRRLG